MQPILFAQDWGLYPTAKAHLSTSNTSFLKLAHLYKSMGVSNYAFPLALVQPHLEFVDPHSSDLDLKTQIDIKFECRINPWYYLREVARVPPQAGGVPGPMRANRGTLALWWSFFNHQDIYLIQPRQTGKSLSSDQLMVYLLTQVLEDTTILLLTKDDQLRTENVERIKEIRLLLPAYLNPQSKKDKDNGEMINVTRLNNKYITAVARMSPSAANGIGRGLTCPIYVIDESPFIANIDIAQPAMLAGGNAAKDEAERNGTPYGNIFTTTAGKKDDASGAYVWEILSGGMKWTEHLFDCTDNTHLLQTVRDASLGMKSVINATFSHRQLGYTDAWLLKKMSDAGSFGDKADRDYLNVWTTGTASSPLSTELNNALRESVREPDWMEFSKYGYTLNWYIPRESVDRRMAIGKYIMGIDSSEGLGRDATAIYIVDSSSLETIATAAVKEANLIRLAEWIKDIMVRFENIIAIPERRSTGTTIIDMLLLKLPAVGIDPFRRVYNTIVDEGKFREPEFRTVMSEAARRPDQFYDRVKRYFGFATAGSGAHSRSALYKDTLQHAAAYTAAILADKGTVDEITALVMKNERIDHASGGHDDRVISWLLSHWMLAHSRNLSFYGITSALSTAVDFNTRKLRLSGKYDAEDEYEANKRKAIKEEITGLVLKIQDCRDDVLAAQYEYRLRMLDARYGEELGEAFSIDSLIKEAKAEKNKRGRDNRVKRPSLALY